MNSLRDHLTDDSYAFLAGGGEMGERTRAFDWSNTPVGPPSGWPQSLRTAVSICLGSRYPITMWWGSTDYTTFYNDAYRPVLGVTKHPGWLGRSGRECWSDVWHIVGPMLESVFATGEATWSEDLLLIMGRNMPQEETYFTFSYSPIRDDSGRIGGIFCAVTETTTRVIGERRLRALRDLSRTVTMAKSTTHACAVAADALAANPADIPFVLIYLLDGDGRCAVLAGQTRIDRDTSASPAAIELDAPEALWPFRQVIEGGKPVEVTDLCRKFGPLPGGVWPEPPDRAVVLPLAKPGQGRLAGFMVAGVSSRLVFDDDYRGFMDLLAGHVAAAVASARAYEEERRQAEALAELDRAKTAFFSNVSHEFRTPLTLMLGPVEGLLARTEADLPPDVRGELEIVNRNGLRLLRLVNSLLDFSRIEAGRVQATYQPTDLAALTADLASVFRSACERAGLRLEVDCPPLDEPVFVDPEMWEKVVLNLLSNAFKFTFEGGIIVSVRQSGRAAELRVLDTGTGIPVEEMPRLFERFHRIENARGRTYEGSGIGLALVQELVKLHGGSITVESVVGVGTTFTVTVPQGSAHLPADRIVGGRAPGPVANRATPYIEEALCWLPSESGGGWRVEGGGNGTDLLPPPSTLHPPPSTRPRILVADDNTDMRQYVVRLLAGPFRVEAVPDGEAALAATRERAPDLILTDVMMPRLDGFGLLKELRADPRTQNIPVIMLSARAGEESRVEGLEAGADDYLVKPFAARELLARVTAHLQMARLRREAGESLRQSEERFRVLFETMSEGFAIDEILFDDNGRGCDLRYLEVNPAFERHTGLKRADILGRTTRQLFPDSEPDWFERYGEVVTSGIPAHFQAKFGPLDRWFAVSAYKTGPKQFATVFFDITDRMRAEEALRQRVEEIQTLHGTLAIGVAIAHDSECRRITGNSAVYAMLRTSNPNLSKSAPAGEQPTHYRLCRNGVELPISELPLQRAARGEQVRNEEVDHIFEDGSVLHTLLSAAPLYDEQGRVRGAVASVLDVTERKRAESQLRASEERFRTLFESMEEGFCVIEMLYDADNRPADYRFLEANPTFEKHTGIKDAVGRTIRELVPNHDSHWYEIYGRVAATGEATRFVNETKAIGRWFDVYAYRVGGPDSRRVGIIFTDITARKRDEEKKRELVRELETQNAFVKAVLSQVPAAIVVADADTGQIRITNEEAHRIVRHEYHPGKRLEDYGNTHIREAYATDGRRYVSGQWPLDRARRGETVVAEEIELVLSDESRVIVRVNASPIQVGEKIVAAVVAFHDITDRKLAERSARFLADASAALAGLVDYEDTLQRVARLAVPGFADWAVVDMAEETGSARRLVVAHADPAKAEMAQALHRRFAHAANASRPANILRTGLAEIQSTLTDDMLIAAATDEDDLRLLRELGLKSYIGVPLKVQGKTVGVLTFLLARSGRRYGKHDLAVAKDLASRASIAIENSQLYARLREADRRKTEFLATLAHELRNPLAPLRNGLQVMKLVGNDGEAVEQCRSMMDRQLGQMVRLVDDLMDINRINQGKLELRKERVELAAVIHSAIDTSRPLVEAMGHELEIVLPKQPVVVEADLTRLAQVFLNLLNNAAKYTERGGHLWLTAERQGSDVVVSVRDNGIGIAAEQLPRLFEMFSQADRALERAQGGLGIGLSLVKRLVEMHGGRIEARSDGPGEGAEFVVRLPAVIDEALMPQTDVVKGEGDGKTALRILVVDDNRDSADSLAMILQMMGNDTRTAYDGEEALAVTSEFRPAVILLDIGLPKLNGYDACRRIRTLPGGKKVVLIAQTGWGQDEDRQRTQEAGFDHHLVKPVDPAALMKLLAGLSAATT